MTTATRLHRPVSPWIFGVTNIPFGVSGGFTAAAMPYLLRQAGVGVQEITQIAALALMPAAWQFLWAPVIDTGPKRKIWLVIVSFLGALCTSAALLVPLPTSLGLFKALVVAGAALTGLVGSCNGGLMATSLDIKVRGKASGWSNAANLGGSALGGGAVMSLLVHISTTAAAIGLFFATFLPALAALRIDEPERDHPPLGVLLREMGRETWRTLRARNGWTGVLFCLSPVGTAAMLNLFSGVAQDYRASDDAVAWINGYWGGLVTAIGALASGALLDRFDRRRAYLLAGALTALCALAMSFGPLNPTTYTVGALAYLLVSGLCYAAFSAVVLDIVGDAGRTAATQYTLFSAAGNQAIAYVMLIDGVGYSIGGPRGMLRADALANVLGVGVLLLLLRFVLARRSPPSAPSA